MALIAVLHRRSFVMLKLFDSPNPVLLVSGQTSRCVDEKESVATSESGEPGSISFAQDLPPALEIVEKNVPSLSDGTRAFKPSLSWSL